MQDEKKVKGSAMSEEELDKVSGGVMSVQTDPTAKYASSTNIGAQSRIPDPKQPEDDAMPMGAKIPDPKLPGKKYSDE